MICSAGSRWPFFCIAPVLLLSGSVAADPPAGRRPNVVLIVSDDQRPDTIHALGNPYIRTPNLDRLVRMGTVIEQAVCANPICTPSRAEILSGCSSFRNGVMDFGGRLRPQLVLWPEAMRRAGYHTWYVGKWHNDGRPRDHGYELSRRLFAGGGSRWWRPQQDYAGRPVTGYRGWVFQDDQGRKFPELGVGLTLRSSERIADGAVVLIRRRPRRPFFLHVNFTAPHDPLLPPQELYQHYLRQRLPLPVNFLPRHPFDHGNLRGRDELLLGFPRTPEEVRRETAAYYAVIEQMDWQLGRILQALEDTDQLHNTIIIFTSDHGVALGSHGLRGKQNMYEHTIRVPLVMAGPGIPQGKRLMAQVHLRQLYPTVCRLCGVEVPGTVEAAPFEQLLRGQDEAAGEPYTFGYYRQVQRMVRTPRWKLIWYPRIDRVQLFHLAQDPHELHDLSAAGEHRRIRQQLWDVLQRQLARWNDPVLRQQSAPVRP